MRIEIAGLRAVRDGALELPGCGKRAACVTMSRRPVRPDCEQTLVGRRRRFMFPSIAEHPSAQIGDFFSLRLQIECVACALDRGIATPLVVQRLAQLTIDPAALAIGNVAAPE